MRSLIVVAILTLTFAFSSCSKSKEDQCAKAMDHIQSLTINSPEMKKVSEDEKKKIVEGHKKRRAKNIKKCVENFDQDLVDCVVGSKEMKDLGKCKPKKKK